MTLEVDSGVELPVEESPDKPVEHVVDIINEDSVVLAVVDKLVDIVEVDDKNVIGIIEVIDIVEERAVVVAGVFNIDVIGGDKNFVATVEGGRDSCKGGAEDGRIAGDTGGRLGAMVGRGWIVEGGRGGATVGRGRFNPPPEHTKKSVKFFKLYLIRAALVYHIS